MSFIREKKIYCGENYLEVDIFPYTENQRRRRRRSRKEKVTPPKQKNLNDKNARRYLTQLVNTNFTENDLHVTCTYSKEFFPANREEAEREAINYLRRIAYHRKKQGLPPLKYILVTECNTGKNGEKPVRIHHHILINGGIDRDTLEQLWSRPKTAGEKTRKRIGFVNADRLQPGDDVFAALCAYLTKNPNGKKRWSSSQNLKKPESRTNDSKYSRRQVERLAKSPPDPEYWERKYKGWAIANMDYGYQVEYNEITGWSIYLKLRRKC